jgi:putative nucleotidyltransferase with HDIG domain
MYTKEHSVRVARYSKLIAEKSGYAKTAADFRVIYNAAMLHDIGKVAVPDNILNSSRQLTDEEYGIVKKHTIWGSDILKELTFYPKIFYGARYHHERYDGQGYPEGIKGKDIPVEARIISVADTLDAMNSERVYRKPCSKNYIIDVFENDNGAQFEPVLAKAVCDLIREGKIKILADDNKD